jgi:hypothetical protein
MKQKLLHIVLLIFAINIYGQVTIVGMTDEKEFRQNKKFTLTFILQINGNEYVQESPIKLPDLSKFEQLGNASDQNTIVDPKTGTFINQIVYQYVLQPKETGKVKIGSALVQVNGKMYKSESFDIFVKEGVKKTGENNSTAKSQEDVFLQLEIKDKDIYQYQPTVAVLRVYSKEFDQFRKISLPHFPKQNSIDVESIPISENEIEPSDLYPNWLSQTIAVYTITPNESGRIEVPSAVVNFKNNGTVTKITSNKLKLLVKPLPINSPKNYTNAIGNFEVSLVKSTSEDYQEIGKPFTVTLKISGEGNLNKLVIPELYPSNNYIFYKPNITKNIRENGGSYQGEIVANYIVVPKKAGEMTIKTDNFSFFDNTQQEFIDLGVKEIPINVLTSEQIAKNQTTIEKVNNYTNTVLEKVESPILKTSEFKIKEKSTINWTAILGNLALIFSVIYASLLFSRYQKSKRKKILHTKKVQKPLGSVAETEAEIRSNKKLDYTVYINYLKILAEENNAEKFFATYQDFVDEVNHEILNLKGADTENWLKTGNNVELSNDWTKLQERIRTEKYNPENNVDLLLQLTREIEKIFSKIKADL